MYYSTNSFDIYFMSDCQNLNFTVTNNLTTIDYRVYDKPSVQNFSTSNINCLVANYSMISNSYYPKDAIILDTYNKQITVSSSNEKHIGQYNLTLYVLSETYYEPIGSGFNFTVNIDQPYFSGTVDNT